jgi:hypothetical protein
MAFNMAKDRNIERDNAKKFLEYAAECRRMARTASEADRAVLMQIAEAGLPAPRRRKEKPARTWIDKTAVVGFVLLG